VFVRLEVYPKNIEKVGWLVASDPTKTIFLVSAENEYSAAHIKTI
jgi:hypothetical protein